MPVCVVQQKQNQVKADKNMMEFPPSNNEYKSVKIHKN